MRGGERIGRRVSSAKSDSVAVRSDRQTRAVACLQRRACHRMVGGVRLASARAASSSECIVIGQISFRFKLKTQPQLDNCVLLFLISHFEKCFNFNHTNGTIVSSRVAQQAPMDGTVYKDMHDLLNLTPNTTYTIRVRVKNEFDWSDWSSNMTVRTRAEDSERLLSKHKSPQHAYNHHRHHERKHKVALQSSLNTKRDRFNAHLVGQYSGCCCCCC